MNILKIIKPVSVLALPVLAGVVSLPAHAQTACVTDPATNPLEIGAGALACGQAAAAIGENTTAVGTVAVSVFGTGGTAVGAGSLASGATTGISITVGGVGPAGVAPDADGAATALGSGAFAAGAGSVAIGDQAGVGIASVPGPNQFRVGAIVQGTAVGSMSSVTADGGTALGFDAEATAENSVAIGAGSIADQANTVSIGTVGGQRRIVNVAAGVDGTDAVNVAQMQAADAALQTQIDTNSTAIDAVEAVNAAQQTQINDNAMAIDEVETRVDDVEAVNASQQTQINENSTAIGAVETRVDVVEAVNATQSTQIAEVQAVNTTQTTQINTLTTGLASETNARLAGDALLGERLDDLSFDLRRNGREARAGTSAALAAAALPQAMDAGRSMIAAGVGAYRGRAAFALGASHRLSSGITVMKVGVTYDSSEHVGANAGVGFQF